MIKYKTIGIDLAKRKFHIAAIDQDGKLVFKKAVHRDVFLEETVPLFPVPSHFAMEACGGCHYVAQRLKAAGHRVTLLKPKDVKPYAKSRQKNDLNDALAICKAASDPELKPVQAKTIQQQENAYLHKSRQNAIRQRIQRSNSLMTSLLEFGYLVECGKARFAQTYQSFLDEALEEAKISQAVYDQMQQDGTEITQLLAREKALEKEIIRQNKASQEAQYLLTIPGIGPINASLLSHKPFETYERARDFAASLGLVPRQNTTGGTIRLGSISKQGDRYARTMLIQAGRCLVMRAAKKDIPNNDLYRFIERLKAKGKSFNVICVAVANKLARIAYACLTKQEAFQGAT